MAEWFEASELRKTELRKKERYDKGEIDYTNDFDSYRGLADEKSLDEVQIKSHNAVGQAAEVVAQMLACMCRKYKIVPNSIGDFGGGAGFIADAVSKKFPGVKVFSYDVSEDAGIYGKKNFTDVSFITQALEADDLLSEGKFDCILANEFYPFTRTSDFGYQRKYLDMCLNNLSDKGIVVIGLPEGKTRNNLMKNMEAIRKEYGQRLLGVHCVPYAKLYGLLRNYNCSLWISHIMGKLKKDRHVVIVLQK